MMKFEIDRRKLMLGAGALALGASVPGLAGMGAARAQAATKMTYLTPFGYLIGFSETMYADTGGIFAKNGLDVTIEGGRGSSMAVQQVTAGNALLSRTGGTDLIKAYAKDPSIVAVAEIYQRDIFYMISAESGPINKPEDMAGKTIGIVSAAGATENILDMMLAAKNIKKEDVKREVVGNAPAAFELIKQGRIAGFIATNDTAFQLRTAGQPVVAFSTDDFALCPGQVYMTSKAQLQKSGETIGKFLKSVHETLGILVAGKDLKPIVDSMTAKYQVTEASRPDKGLAVLEYAVGNYKRAEADKLKINPASWTSAYDLMRKAGLIPELADKGFYDESALKAAFG